MIREEHYTNLLDEIKQSVHVIFCFLMTQIFFEFTHKHNTRITFDKKKRKKR